MFGKLPEEEITRLLNQQLIGRIGCHANGLTYVVPVSYVFDGTYIYVHTEEGLKMEIMRKNPMVCFQVDNTSNFSDWQSVICQGEFEELTEEPVQREALEKLQNRILPILSSETMHLSNQWPFYGGKEERMTGLFFRIRVTGKTGRFEKISGQDFFAT